MVNDCPTSWIREALREQSHSSVSLLKSRATLSSLSHEAKKSYGIGMGKVSKTYRPFKLGDLSAPYDWSSSGTFLNGVQSFAWSLSLYGVLSSAPYCLLNCAKSSYPLSLCLVRAHSSTTCPTFPLGCHSNWTHKEAILSGLSVIIRIVLSRLEDFLLLVSAMAIGTMLSGLCGRCPWGPWLNPR